MITLAVTLVLFFYLFSTFWIYLYRFYLLHQWQNAEEQNLDALVMGDRSVREDSALYPCISKNSEERPSRLRACYERATRNATSGLALLSVIATTSPFIGLFGTVIGILQAFATFKDGVSLSIIAPAISEALVATALGILSAIPAYTFHTLLKRKAYVITNLIRTQMEVRAALGQ